MPSTKVPTDPGYSSFGFHTRVKTFPLWKGLNLGGDASQIPGNQFRDVINVRPDSEGLRERGGLAKGASNAATSDMDGIWEASDIGSATETDIPLGTPFNAMYTIGNSALGVDGVAVHVDTASTFTTAARAGDGRLTAPVEEWNDLLVCGIGYDETNASIGTIVGTDIGDLIQMPKTGISAEVFSLCPLSGSQLFVAWQDSAAGGKVSFTEDSETLTGDLLLPTYSSSGRLLLGKLGTTLCLGFAGGSLTNSIMIRTAPATWATHALPSAVAFLATHMLEFNGVLYIIGVDDTDADTFEDAVRIYSTSGGAPTLERTITGMVSPVSYSVDNTSSIGQLGIVGTDLYYWYHDGVSGSVFSRIGKFDGVTWTDNFKNLGTQVGGLSYTRGLGFAAGTNGAEVVFAKNTGDIFIWESPGAVLSGAWSLILTDTAGITSSGTRTPPTRVSKVNA